MRIIDNKGQMIAVTDLPAAIIQAALFKDYRHTDAEFGKQDDELKIYWADLHTKLLKLRSDVDSTAQKNEPDNVI
ncbi:hypothetical protein [Dyadobacter frigoris]|uniref:Uncharacterized protein n=1 Tax=Dyadobacter frigoris TaxID=2576211 RepID=A0A4U6CPY4_9BACT|nr:hypothetical protein [Dyadobacter frigoris]TKT85481.1 hypothetical protein FDK13_33740 [Dyadobacter frigoris]GLU56242.1 hypothetical protein Dfri01_57030 [Dyadobacter frigoris]